MSVERRLAFYSGQRVDVPHIRALESAVSHDFDMLLRGMMTGLNRPYLVRGFRIKIPNAAINASSLQIEVADSVVLHSSATESGTILQTPPGIADETLDSQNSNVIGSFQAGVLNYVALDYRRITDAATVDQTAGWSPSQQLEFQRAVPIGRLMKYRFVISTSGFGTNLPLYIVKTTNNGAVEKITRAIPNFFRLGSGGANPNPLNSFTWGNLVNTQPGANGRREWISPNAGDNPLTVEPGDPANAFDFGDVTIKNLKDFVDAIWTRFKEITGSQYGYMSSSLPGSGGAGGLNLADVYWDSIGSVITGAGEISYNLVLESSQPTDGAFQAQFLDNTILPGEVYVEGLTSGTKANLTSFNASQLLINSMTRQQFVYGETIQTRRLFSPNANRWVTDDYSRQGSRYAQLFRKTSSPGVLPNNIDTWSFENHDAADGAVAWSLIEVETLTPHGLMPGEFARIDGLTGTAVPPNGVHRILKVSSPTTLLFATSIIQSGAPSVAGSNGAVIDTQDRHPYSPHLVIAAIAPGGGTLAALTVPNHNYLAPQNLTGDFSSGDNVVSNVSDVSNLKLGMKVVSANFAAGHAYILAIDTVNDEIVMSDDSTATAAADPFVAKQQVVVNGLNDTVISDEDMNGLFDIEGLSAGNEILIDLGTALTSGSVDSDAHADLAYHEFRVTVEDALPDQYNVINVRGFAIAGDKVQYFLGPDSLPALEIASGPIRYDGVVAVSIVADPVRVDEITNDGAGNLTVTTFTPHGLQTGGPLSFTIFGNSQLSDYIRSYNGVTISVIDPTTFEIQGTGIISMDTYTNPGTDNTFVRFADNPYAGPVQWSEDIVIKGIMGDISFRVPKTATVDMTDPDVSPTANQYNVNGQTGTAYLQDREVMFIKLKRNLQVSNGTVYSTAGGNSLISTPTPMLDEDGVILEAGDWIKWADEPDNRWLRIRTINPTTVELETDGGQEPSIAQRPSASGEVMYSKGTYDKVYVKQHYLVDASASSYWLAVRRDNDGNRSKVYFRNLEIEAGEVRQVNDNEMTNLLKYTGAFSESAVNPNYSVSDTTGDFQYEADLTIEDVDNLTHMVTFVENPSRLMEIGDRIRYYDGSQWHYWSVRQPITTRTVILEQDTSMLSGSQEIEWLRENKFIEDQDNLTLAHRKQDRQAGHVDTFLRRPVYDESCYIQKINLSGSGTVRSGSFIYKGPITNPTALAWVLHGNASVNETIEGALIGMPGGHTSIGSNAILVNILFGSFQDGDGVFQNGAATGRTVDNPGNPPFEAPEVYGDTSSGGVEMVLPPNRRTQLSGPGGIAIYGQHSFYKQAIDQLGGEELLVIVNDGVREANFDYEETFGGPKAKIRLRRSTPPNTRMRFRLLAAYGSAIAAKSAEVTLQSAYNAGNTIQTTAGRPVEITGPDVNAGAASLVNRGSMLIAGGLTAEGGIYNESGDQGFKVGREDNKPKEVWSGYNMVKTHASHPGSANQTKTAAQVITGDAGTIISDSAITLIDGYAYRVKISATARRSDGPLGVSSFTLEGTFYRSGGGALSAGSPASQVNGFDGDGAAYALAFGLSGNDVVAVAYGTSGATVQWVLTIEWQAVGVA